MSAAHIEGCLMMVKSHVIVDPERVKALRMFLSDRGVRVVYERRLGKTAELQQTVSALYQEHKGKWYHKRLIDSVSGGVILMYITKPHLFRSVHSAADVVPAFITNMRVLLGNTDPAVARSTTPRTIRGSLSLPSEELPHNVAHCSDSMDSAVRELNLMFPVFAIDFEGCLLSPSTTQSFDVDIKLTVAEVEALSDGAFEKLWADLPFVQGLFAWLSDTSGCSIHIISLGEHRVVRALLGRAGLATFVEQIHTPLTYAGAGVKMRSVDFKLTVCTTLEAGSHLPRGSIVCIDDDAMAVHTIQKEGFDGCVMYPIKKATWGLLERPQNVYPDLDFAEPVREKISDSSLA